MLVKTQSLDFTSAENVRLLNAGLVEHSDGDIVAHGWLDIESMLALRADDYQREVLGNVSSKKTNLLRALEKGAVFPDIVVGMRGSNYEDGRGGTMILTGRCYIIDGLQRISALLQHAANIPPEEAKKLRQGCEVRFGTTREKERELFLALNTSRIPVSPNVILRNLREQHRSVLALYGLSTNDPKFALHERVCWNQRLASGELTTALILAKVARSLHYRGNRLADAAKSGGGGGERPGGVAVTLDMCLEEVGMQTFRRNVSEFFDIVDKCFGLREIKYKEVSPQLRGNFLITLARMFVSHSNFWDGHKLVIDAATRRKLSTFPLGNPEVVRLSGAGNMAMPILYQMLVEHMNKGKRTKRLEPR